MESVSCCYHDDNPAMSNECGAQLNDAVGWRSLNKQARCRVGVGGQKEEWKDDREKTGNRRDFLPGFLFSPILDQRL